MTTIKTEIETFGHLGNNCPVRMPGRRYAGIVMQWDTLLGLIQDLETARKQVLGGDSPQDVAEELDAIAENLRESFEFLRETVERAGMPLPL